MATALSLALGAVVRRAAPMIGAVVPPRPDRWHEAATPSMGGIGIALAAACGLLVLLARPELREGASIWLPVVLAAGAMFLVGILDDRLQLSPVAKLVASLFVGAFLVFALAGTELGGLPWGDTLLAIVWFAGLCHAMNLLDNMDGLASGVGLIAALFLAIVLGTQMGGTLVGVLMALAGALLGFFYWNRSRARLFMGDCGSLFIGAVLGGCSLVPVFRAGDTLSRSAMMAVLILVVPLFDTSFVLVLRRLAGRPATRGGTDHVSHRLVSLGFSDRSAVRILYVVGLGGGGTAVALASLDPDVMLPAVALFMVLIGLLGIYLARVPAYNAADFLALQKSSFAPFLKDLTFRWHAGQVLLDLVLISASYYFAYWLRFPNEQFAHFLPFFGASLPAVLGLKLASLYVSGLYRRSWQTFGLRDIGAVLRGVGLGSLLSVLVAAYVYRLEGFSRVVFILDALLLTAAVLGTRAFFPAMDLVASTRSKRSRRVVIYGAGGFGQMLVREFRANTDWRMNPVGYVDDDPAKTHRWIGGVPVRGTLDTLDDVLDSLRVEELIISTRAVEGDVERRIRAACAARKIRVRRLSMELH